LVEEHLVDDGKSGVPDPPFYGLWGIRRSGGLRCAYPPYVGYMFVVPWLVETFWWIALCLSTLRNIMWHRVSVNPPGVACLSSTTETGKILFRYQLLIWVNETKSSSS
jgi:hypothetical protein